MCTRTHVLPSSTHLVLIVSHKLHHVLEGILEANKESQTQQQLIEVVCALWQDEYQAALSTAGIPGASTAFFLLPFKYYRIINTQLSRSYK